MTTISMTLLEDFCASALVRKGVPEQGARIVARITVLTEAFGIHTHGLTCFHASLKAIDDGRIRPQTEPQVVSQRLATAVIDGQNTFGQLAFQLAKDVAIRKCRAGGAAMIGVKHTSWIGAIAPYLLDIPEQGLAAQVYAQTSGCKDCAPIGGIDAKFSTNPIGLAFPVGETAVIADFSTASLSMMKIGQMQQAGEKAPEAIFLDARGNLTDDPNVTSQGGSVLFVGGRHFGHKGYALSLWCEAMTAVAGGSANNPDVPGRQSLMLTVVDPDAFAGSDYFTREITRFVTHLKSNRLRPGFEEIRLPGERGLNSLAHARQHGITLADHQLAALATVARECQLSPLG